jgi:CHAD domain-containing protein
MAKPKEIRGLDCAGAAGEGARLVLFSRFEEMCEYRGAALDGSDIEGVHDMRVASRRMRSALRDYRPHLRGGKRFEAARAALRRLADALGAVRDEDVAIHALGKLKEGAPSEEVKAGVEEYAAERRARREEARARLIEALSEESVGEARRRLAHALEERGKGRRGKEGDDESSFADAQLAVVRRLWWELAALSPSLYRPRKARRLHEMRIAAKRLRYALELLANCRADGEPKELASAVADLQGALGDLHDCDVWAEDLGGQLARGGLSDERRAAAVWLLGHFVGQRAEHYREALNLWHEWERTGFGEKVSG